ncbi:DUF6339 family protein [Streptomyces galilaeus]|uniref:DUF6339 family protein n=1 Tax=Streptomyces galilaeus TaxID=33899 RepID=UPI00123CC4AE|nr:DUF6339 family protein [Streptomyces galilaeus]GGW83783.1 hypothetical protein GCM10010350_80730 [Streptomyces galilaeus]
MTTLYPRLSDAEGRILLDKIRHEDVATLSHHANLDHPKVYAPTGGIPAGRGHLLALADAVRGCAMEFGYPDGSVQDTRAFDRALASAVFETTDMAPAEAAAPEVWTYLATQLVPDVVMWRWQPRFNEERWIGRGLVRHTLGRLWWQAYALAVPVDGGRDYSLLETLSEMDLNQVFERRSIGGTPVLARALVTELADARVVASGLGRRQVVGDVTKRICRLLPFTSFLTLDEPRLRQRMRDVITESLTALKAQS